MGILFGFLCLLTLCLLLVKFLSRKFHFRKFDGLLKKIHKHLCAAFIVLCIFHFAFVFPVLKTRSLTVCIMGIAIVFVFALIVFFCHRMGKDQALRLRWHRILSVVFLLFAVFHIAVYYIDFYEYQMKIEKVRLQEIDLSQIKDGQYIGEYDAGYIYAKVRVLVLNGSIQKVDILEHLNERGQAAEQITEKITDTQDFPVDTVSGATNSSKVIQQAVQNALN